MINLPFTLILVLVVVGFIYLLFYQPQQAIRILSALAFAVYKLFEFVFKVVVGVFSAVGRLFERFMK